MRQPPSDGNALGKVKFMFPNPYNIYLHDTPAKAAVSAARCAPTATAASVSPTPSTLPMPCSSRSLPTRRTNSRASSDTGIETGINLDDPVPVHLVYFTAYPTAKGQMTYRRDIYGRDARIFEALTEAGVALDQRSGVDLRRRRPGWPGQPEDRMAHTIRDIAPALGAEAEGDLDLDVTGAAEPAMAGPDDLRSRWSPNMRDGLSRGQGARGHPLARRRLAGAGT